MTALRAMVGDATSLPLADGCASLFVTVRHFTAAGGADNEHSESEFQYKNLLRPLKRLIEEE